MFPILPLSPVPFFATHNACGFFSSLKALDISWRACHALPLLFGGLRMFVVGTFFTWVDAWTAPYELVILTFMVVGLLSWTLRTSR